MPSTLSHSSAAQASGLSKGNVHGPAIAHEGTVVIEIYDDPHYPPKPSWYTDERDAR